MNAYLSTREVCEQTGLTEPGLRHVLRRPGAPRPQLHPSARVFLWTQEDIEALRRFLSPEEAGHPEAVRDGH
jgi:hypothetical protein